MKSRTAAQALIRAGCVFVNGKCVTKPSELADRETDQVEIKEADTILRYVGRGGFKLEHAVKTFGLSLEGRCCLDVGASTGGFTDCMLQNGARKVFAVDVGHGQLAAKLRADPRVISLEGLDLRDAGSEIEETVDFIGVDVSFISLKLILPELRRFISGSAECTALIKPQFENGCRRNGKNGVIKDASVHRRIVEDLVSFAEGNGFQDVRVTASPIPGGDGNREFLMYGRL